MERRRATRRVPEGEEPLARVRLRTGFELDVVNVSNSGVLVEGSARLLPGTHLEVHVTTREGRVLVRCRVIRSCVCHLQADVIRYRSALAFDRSVDAAFAGQDFPSVLAGAIAASGSAYPAGASTEAALDPNAVSF